MRKKSSIALLILCTCLSGCLPPNPVPLDPYEGHYCQITLPVSKGDTTDSNQSASVTETPLPTAGVVEGKEEGKPFEEYLHEMPDYNGKIAVDVPAYGFDKTVRTAYEYYSELDALGRCGMSEALIGKELMPTEPRGEIGMVKPSGWHTVKYPELIEDLYLYNRCHVIGFQLTGENDNVRNLISGTRFFNVEGMLPYENIVASYIRLTGNHVYYRVTPIFEEENLLCKGVWMEAESMEDGGAGVKFSVFVHNIQPGIWIDYATGDSCVAAERGTVQNFILNTKTLKFHELDCEKVSDIGGKNKKEYEGTREVLTEDGYSPCGWCNP